MKASERRRGTPGVLEIFKFPKMQKKFNILKIKGPRKACFFLGIFRIFKILKKAEKFKNSEKHAFLGPLIFRISKFLDFLEILKRLKIPAALKGICFFRIFQNFWNF